MANEKPSLNLSQEEHNDEDAFPLRLPMMLDSIFILKVTKIPFEDGYFSYVTFIL